MEESGSLQLPYLTRQSLVQLHFTASNLTNHTTDSWSIEEDAYLLAARLSGKRPQDAKLPPREPARTIRAMRRTFRRPFPSSWRPPRSEMPKRVARLKPVMGRVRRARGASLACEVCDTSYHEGPTRGDRCAGTMGVRYTARARGGAPRESRESETYPYPQSRGYGGPLVSCLHTSSTFAWGL
jgi:hypothetical protein